MKRRLLISGPVLVGFNELFARSYGNPKTPRPYPKVTPARVGGALLAFPCPHCGDVREEMASPRNKYSDATMGFSWCPSCRGRYLVNYKGGPLVGTISPGAKCAPARVEIGGKVSVVGVKDANGLLLLGAD